MKTYKCIKGFYVEKVDDDGHFTDEEMKIKKGSEWETNDYTNIIGGQIHLNSEEIVDEHSRTLLWIELDKETLKEYFEEI